LLCLLFTDSVVKEQGCFAADSFVTLADGNRKLITHLQPGDSLLTYHDQTKQIISTHLLTMLDFQPSHFGKLSHLSLIHLVFSFSFVQTSDY
jgi:hypothetical protein